MFMGMLLSEKGIDPTAAPVKAVLEVEEPKRASDVRSFLGLANYSSGFIPHFATLSEPLRRLTSKETPFKFGPEEKKSFECLKQKMAEACTLAYFDKNTPTKIITDAGPVGLGAVLVQEQDNTWTRPGRENIADPLSHLLHKRVEPDNHQQYTEEYIRFVAVSATPTALKTREIEEDSADDEELKEYNDCLQHILDEHLGKTRAPDAGQAKVTAKLKGFQLHHKDRIGRSDGRILAFVNSSLQVKRREDLEETDLECLWLETCPFKSKRPLLIAGVYRPPSFKAADDKRLGKNIENGVKARDKLLVKARKSQAERDWNAFKRAKNTVTKQSYFKDKVTENRNNSRKLWNLIKCLSKDDEGAENSIKELVENKINISDKQSIAEILNSFFVDQPKKLVAALGLGSQTDPPTMTSISQGNSAFDLPRITQKRVVELLSSIPTHKATGDDGISAKILRIAAPAIAPSLTKLLNHCLSTQIFPNAWKITKVTPVFKGNGSRNEKNTYRPISVLPILSKVLEKHICEYLVNFLKENDLFHPLQSGFRESHSTETALIRLVDQLLFNLDNVKATGLVFIDYKKAFDLIDHNLLLSKLKALGVGEGSLPLFRDYLSGRRQYVNIDGHHSTQRTLTLGVPQGSILGPILFLVFINDLPATLQHSVADIYADDTTISYSTHYTTAPNDISVGLQTDIDEILNWSADNRMILNETKTKSMLVTGKRLAKKMEQSTLQLNVNSTELEQVNSHKLLGVTIDSQLTFDQHVENLCTKLSQRIAVLRKIRRFLPIDQRKLYYNAMIKQTMLYASTIWTSCSAENLQKVFKLQKHAAHVILGADTEANSVQLFRKLDWDPFFHEAKVNRQSKPRHQTPNTKQPTMQDKAEKIQETLGKSLKQIDTLIVVHCRTRKTRAPDAGQAKVTAKLKGNMAFTTIVACISSPAEKDQAVDLTLSRIQPFSTDEGHKICGVSNKKLPTPEKH
ncbi:putative RNA-directed DNA polymerase from transposon BS [Stylophora pistillata]|uniref:Putative RNA-directed DNA polymerase from transposon BS n=1 Tax=Stylophora pistillata TaxID=50429 RepID=A0A2B4RL57_STYPI|nr:putative RNA-directed DNA polymerase from transposon BS [Stylophora pistillata]